jgi:hypothetical protein
VEKILLPSGTKVSAKSLNADVVKRVVADQPQVRRMSA